MKNVYKLSCALGFLLFSSGYVAAQSGCSYVQYFNTSDRCPNETNFASYFAQAMPSGGGGMVTCKVQNVDGNLNSYAGATLDATVNGSTTTSIGVKWLTSGSHYIEYKCPCESGTITRTQFINVLPTSVSAGTISNSSMCVGGSTTLTASGVVGSVLRWEKKLPGDSWTSATTISNTTNLLPSNLIDNTTTMNYRIVVGNNCVSPVYAEATVTVNSLSAPPVPTNGDISSSCGQIIAIETSTNYAAGYTIKHHYYDGAGTPLTEALVASNPFTSTVYYSQFNPGPFASPKIFQVEAEVVGTGGCPSQFSGRKTFTYTINGPPQPPSSLQI